MEASKYGMLSLRKVLQDEGFKGLYWGKSEGAKRFFLSNSEIIVQLAVSNNIIRLFCLSLLHPPLPHDILPAIWARQVAFQGQARLGWWLIQIILCERGNIGSFLQCCYQPILGGENPYASRNIPFSSWRALWAHVPRNIPLYIENRKGRGGEGSVQRTYCIDTWDQPRLDILSPIWALEDVL